MQNIYLNQSLKIAEEVEKEFSTKANRKSRGVKQAPFYVISRTNMPSILIECGFLTNPKEEEYLQTFSELDALANTDQDAFEDAYYELDIDMRNAYLSDLLADGQISEINYKKSVITNLIKDGMVLSELPDGTYITGDSLYEDYRILEFPELADTAYTQEEINFARQNNLDPKTWTETNIKNMKTQLKNLVNRIITFPAMLKNYCLASFKGVGSFILIRILGARLWLIKVLTFGRQK